MVPALTVITNTVCASNISIKDKSSSSRLRNIPSRVTAPSVFESDSRIVVYRPSPAPAYTDSTSSSKGQIPLSCRVSFIGSKSKAKSTRPKANVLVIVRELLSADKSAEPPFIVNVPVPNPLFRPEPSATVPAQPSFLL